MKTAIVAGASGLVGQALVGLLLANEHYSSVKVLVRRQFNIVHPKLSVCIVNFEEIDKYAHFFEGENATLFVCLGTTMAKAGSKSEFYKVDYTYVAQLAKIAEQQNIDALCLVSSIGADPTSRVYYSSVKGQIETFIKNLQIPSIHILRPSLLLGDRQEKRLGESLGVIINSCLGWLMVGPLKKYRGISATLVAQKMLDISLNKNPGVHIYESDQIYL